MTGRIKCRDYSDRGQQSSGSSGSSGSAADGTVALPKQLGVPQPAVPQNVQNMSNPMQMMMMMGSMLAAASGGSMDMAQLANLMQGNMGAMPKAAPVVHILGRGANGSSTKPEEAAAVAGGGASDIEGGDGLEEGGGEPVCKKPAISKPDGDAGSPFSKMMTTLGQGNRDPIPEVGGSAAGGTAAAGKGKATAKANSKASKAAAAAGAGAAVPGGKAKAKAKGKAKPKAAAKGAAKALVLGCTRCRGSDKVSGV